MLSSVLSACAIYVSVQSLRTSERTLKIANRAYVGLVSGKLQFSSFGIVERDRLGGYLIVRMDLSATIQNAGNSPAREGRFMPKYQRPPGWSEAPAWLKRNLARESVGTIGPKSTVNWNYTDLFALTSDAYSAFRNDSGERVVTVEAEVDFKDVFDETSTVKWCWAAATNERQTRTTGCGTDLQLVVPPPN